MTEVYDRWHLSRPRPGDTRSCEHKDKMPSSDHGRGKRWQVRYRDPSGKQCKENFEKKADAERCANDIEHELNRGIYVDPADAREKFASVATRWREGALHRLSTAARVDRALRLRILPELGNRPISAIKPSELRRCVKKWSADLEPSTLRVEWSYVVSIFGLAALDRIIPFNPCEGMQLPEIDKAELEPLPIEVVSALIDAAPKRYRALVALAAGSGLRQGELFGLEVEHFEALRRKVRVEQQLSSADNEKEVYLAAPKTPQSRRRVPLAPSVVEEVAAHLAAFPPQLREILDRTDPRNPRRRQARLIFTTKDGGPIRRGTWAHAMAGIIRRANEMLAPEKVPAGTSMHDLRHFYASVLIAAKEDVKTVQRRLGHTKPSITLDIYTHWWPDAEDTSAAAIEAALTGSAPVVPSERAGGENAQVKRLDQR